MSRNTAIEHLPQLTGYFCSFPIGFESSYLGRQAAVMDVSRSSAS
jgi:hypothetical protein